MTRQTLGSLELVAPLSGPLVALENVPDPVFAQKLVGDGISIDPIDQILRAPCDGEVVQLHRAHHAVTLRSENNIEILMHIGIDTVALKGAGFQPKVSVGDRVKVGEALIEFDADFVATKAKSLLTQIIITNGEKLSSIQHKSGTVHASDDLILSLVVNSEYTSSNEDSDAETLESTQITIPNPTGLHARPAAILVAEAKKFSAHIVLCKDNQTANAKSLVSIMGLEIGNGDVISVQARGEDAQQAIDTLLSAIRAGLGEDCSVAVNDDANPEVAETWEDEDTIQGDTNTVIGVCASPGLAIGQVYQMTQAAIDVPERASFDVATEEQALSKALEGAHAQLQVLQEKMDDQEKAAIFAAHQELLSDPALLDECARHLAEGKSAAFAWQTAYSAQSQQLAKLKNEVLAGRANDLRDVGRRVLRLILGLADENTEIPDNVILIAEDLTPSDTANIDRTKVLGFCTVTGGASSHVAILARSLNLPAIAGIEGRALTLKDGERVILDASQARLQLNPSDSDIKHLQEAKIALERKREDDLAHAHAPALTQCGRRLEIVANIGGADDARACIAKGGEGVGLCRSEFLFMNRATAPNEDEQFSIYLEMANTLKKGQPLVIRTLDVGGDKPLPYLSIEAEDNPFLGLRGIRVCLKKPALFRVQLRAILRAAEAARDHSANIMVMFPMVTTMDDLIRAKTLLEEEREKLGVKAIAIGIMVEVPTTAVMAEQFAKEVDFFSIGTNDLTQYTLAMDRGHPILAAQADGLNPGVLALIANTVKGAHKHNAWVGVCGGIASDAIATPILIGMGVDELSVSVPSIPEIKAAVRKCSLESCEALALQAIASNSADEVRKLVGEAHPDLLV